METSRSGGHSCETDLIEFLLKVSRADQKSKVIPHRVLGFSLNWHSRILAKAGLCRPSKEGARVEAQWRRESRSLARKSFFSGTTLFFC